MQLTGLDTRLPDVAKRPGTATHTPAHGHLGHVPPLPPGQRSCCCPSQAFVRVLIPLAAARAKPTDLYLCAHHFRAGRAALTRIGAVAFDRDGDEMTRNSPVFLPWEPPTSACEPATPTPHGVDAHGPS